MRLLVIVLIVVAGLLFAGGGYLLGLKPDSLQSESKIKTIVNSPKPSPVDEVSTSTPQPTTRSDAKTGTESLENKIQLALKTSFTTKNYGDIKPYLATKILMSRDSSGCCGDGDAQKAVDFIAGSASSGGSWSFEESNATIKKIKSMEEFKDAVVGVSNTSALVFRFDDNNKIYSIVYYPNYKVITN